MHLVESLRKNWIRTFQPFRGIRDPGPTPKMRLRYNKGKFKFLPSAVSSNTFEGMLCLNKKFDILISYSQMLNYFYLLDSLISISAKLKISVIWRVRFQVIHNYS